MDICVPEPTAVCPGTLRGCVRTGAAVPATAVTACPLNHIQMTFFICLGAYILTTWKEVSTHPLKNVNIISLRSLHPYNVGAPCVVIGSHSLENVEVPLCSRCTAGVFGPTAAVSHNPLQRFWMPESDSHVTLVRKPRASVRSCSIGQFQMPCCRSPTAQAPCPNRHCSPSPIEPPRADHRRRHPHTCDGPRGSHDLEPTEGRRGGHPQQSSRIYRCAGDSFPNVPTEISQDSLNQ